MAIMIPHMDFRESKEKVKRAVKHINDLDAMLSDFSDSDFYSLHIDKDVNTGTNHLRLEIDKFPFPVNAAALIIGDALHNLRSSLDLLYYATVINCGGTPSKWTRFPIRDTREELMGVLNSALKQKQITMDVHDFILDAIKPYEAGNYPLWAADDLNIRDKHQLLIPVLKAMWFNGIRLEDDKQNMIFIGPYIMDEAGSLRLRELIDKNITVQDKGQAVTNIFFDIGTPFDGQPVGKTLNNIAEVITCTIKEFEIIFNFE